MADCPAVHDEALRMSYRVGRGEQGVLTFEPYKSHLLPLWRFRTVAVARSSAAALAREFDDYGEAGDFVGMDMARKFLQMGMTRAKRYANYAGGRKYAKQEAPDNRSEDGEKEKDKDEDEQSKNKNKTKKQQLDKSKAHAGKQEKEQASLVFREVWQRCKDQPRYQELKEHFLAEQRAWDAAARKKQTEEKKEEEED